MPKKGAFKASSTANVIHSPRLDTIVMVEETLQRLRPEPTRNQLWRALPKAVMWQTFCLILEYLEHSRKIAVSDEGKVEWVFKGVARAKPVSYEHDIESHVYIG